MVYPMGKFTYALRQRCWRVRDVRSQHLDPPDLRPQLCRVIGRHLSEHIGGRRSGWDWIEYTVQRWGTTGTIYQGRLSSYGPIMVKLFTSRAECQAAIDATKETDNADRQ